MAAACMVNTDNLVPGHAYGVLQGLCLTTNGACVQKLVQMRNPWGKVMYTGPWSDNSDLWTDEWKTQAALGTTNEGEFWVALEDWRSFYGGIYDTHWRDDWKVSSIEGNPATFTKSTQQNTLVSFVQTVEQDVIIDCVQYNKRL